MAVAANLGATPNKSVRIDHRAFSHISPHVDKHRRHANHAPADVTAIADARAARNDADAIGSWKCANATSGLVAETLLRRGDGPIGNSAHAKRHGALLLR